MKLFWKFYSILLLSIVSSNAYQILNRDSMLGVYYNITIVFSHWYIIPYFLNIFNALLMCIVCLFVFGYAFDIQALSKAPKWLFYLRILSDCTGHSYEVKMLESGFSQGAYLGFIALLSLILPLLPSYLAQWRMTFYNKK